MNNQNYTNTLDFARNADAKDKLAGFRNRFHMPQHKGNRAYYFCGNSLGLQPDNVQQYIGEELEDWRRLGVEGHLKARHPWFPYHEFLRESTARLVNALPHEVVVMNSLTANLHLLMVSFYRPDSNRYKIIFENNLFPSDRYAISSQTKFHANKNGGELFNSNDAMIELSPREGEISLRTEDILSTIQKHKDSLALVLLGGVNYFSGQVFDMKAITAEAHNAGAVCGFDLAHATGNVNLELHDWDVDFAAWCSYKYLNAGPGAVGGAFIHDRHSENFDLPRFAGWWGNDPDTRFTMPDDFVPRKGADGWQLSNAPVFSMAALRASMEIFDDAGMESLISKSKNLTGYLEFIIDEINKTVEGKNHINIITPANAKGCQLSLVIKNEGKKLHDFLNDAGVIADWRHPNVIRVAPVPLYNNYEDVFVLGKLLKQGIDTIAGQ
jgi:kynureninase